MKPDNTPVRTLRPTPGAVEIIDQTALPHACRVMRLTCLEDVVRAIRDMRVRGAPLIGVTAAYGVALALAAQDDDGALDSAVALLAATRPTAVNLGWALARMRARLAGFPAGARAEAAWLAHPAGRYMIDRTGVHLGQPSPDFQAAAAAAVRQWQGDILALVT
ncbi:MAG: hypothetical protein LBU46_06690, partial [Candidatus Accumulibacter sp.]|nr:hypothetical protein [Accumulibacter sp.]